MYMGRTMTFTCPRCRADVFVSVDHGENLAQCQDCEGLFGYDPDTQGAWIM